MSTTVGGALAADPCHVAGLEKSAGEAARLLRLLANERRLMVLCHLVEVGEMHVGALATTIGLSQPAISQHLALLREDGLVATRRAAQTIYYRLADDKAARVIALLRELYCPPAQGEAPAANGRAAPEKSSTGH
jgi:DNA-binding transcriptional ArsR family regulator